MREILFRGKRTDNHQWVEGHYIIDDLENPNPYIVSRWKHRVAHKTVGQYTGMLDKNGKKIFEGDIIRFLYIGKNLGVEGVETVIFRNAKFCVEWGWHREIVCLDGFANTTLEVIGNIHDNPELSNCKENNNGH